MINEINICNIEDICTRLNSLAAECGGDHHTSKEIEAELLSISNQLDKYVFQIMELFESLQKVSEITGMSVDDYKRRQRFNHIIWKNSEDDTEGIGDRINYGLIKSGIQKQELAEKLGVSKSMVTKYIKGLSTPSDDKLNIISSILKVSVNWLKNGKQY